MAKKHLVNDDPVTLTDANKLYLYSLLRQAVGCGRQVFMPRVLEALAAGELEPTRHASYARLYEAAKEIRLWEHKQP